MIQVIDRVFDILELLAVQEGRDLTLSEIARRYGLKKSTCANILKSLQERGYVEHGGRTKGYRLGHKAYLLVGSTDYFQQMGEKARESLERLFESTDETVVFATEYHHRRVILSTIERQFGTTARITHSTDLYRSSAGRIMLAYYPEEKTDAIIERIGLPDIAAWSEISTREFLKFKLEGIRKDGYAVTFSPGEIVGVAVPVFKEGEVIASVGICMPEYRFSDKMLTSLCARLVACAEEIGERL